MDHSNTPEERIRELIYICRTTISHSINNNLEALRFNSDYSFVRQIDSYGLNDTPLRTQRFYTYRRSLVESHSDLMNQLNSTLVSRGLSPVTVPTLNELNIAFDRNNPR